MHRVVQRLFALNGTIWNALRVALRIISGIAILDFAFVALCGALQTHFHRWGRYGKRQLQRHFLRKRGAAGIPGHHFIKQKSHRFCISASTMASYWSGRRGSNSLPPPWQGGALPDELRPHGGEFGFVALSPGDECYYMAFDVKSQAFFAYFFKKSYVYCFSTVSGQFFSRSFRSTLYCLPQNWQLTSAMGSSSRSFSTSFLPRLRMVRSTRSRLQSQQ